MNDKLSLTHKEELYVRKSYRNTIFEMALSNLGPHVMLNEIIDDRKRLSNRYVRSVWLKET